MSAAIALQAPNIVEKKKLESEGHKSDASNGCSLTTASSRICLCEGCRREVSHRKSITCSIRWRNIVNNELSIFRVGILCVSCGNEITNKMMPSWTALDCCVFCQIIYCIWHNRRRSKRFKHSKRSIIVLPRASHCHCNDHWPLWPSSFLFLSVMLCYVCLAHFNFHVSCSASFVPSATHIEKCPNCTVASISSSMNRIRKISEL